MPLRLSSTIDLNMELTLPMVEVGREPVLQTPSVLQKDVLSIARAVKNRHEGLKRLQGNINTHSLSTRGTCHINLSKFTISNIMKD